MEVSKHRSSELVAKFSQADALFKLDSMERLGAATIAPLTTHLWHQGNLSFMTGHLLTSPHLFLENRTPGQSFSCPDSKLILVMMMQELGGGAGVRHSTKVAFALLTQQPRVWISFLLNTAKFMYGSERSNPSSAYLSKWFCKCSKRRRPELTTRKKMSQELVRLAMRELSFKSHWLECWDSSPGPLGVKHERNHLCGVGLRKLIGGQSCFFL